MTRLGTAFVDMRLKPQMSKDNKMGFIKFKNFCASKGQQMVSNMVVIEFPSRLPGFASDSYSIQLEENKEI